MQQQGLQPKYDKFSETIVNLDTPDNNNDNNNNNYDDNNNRQPYPFCNEDKMTVYFHPLSNKMYINTKH